MPKYKLSDLNLGIHPKGEGMMSVTKLGFIEFDYPNPIALIVGFSFLKDRLKDDLHKAVFEIYEKDPRIDGGTWEAKLYVKILGSLDNPSFKVKVEPRGYLRNWAQSELNKI